MRSGDVRGCLGFGGEEPVTDLVETQVIFKEAPGHLRLACKAAEIDDSAGMGDRLGRVQAGYIADLIAVDGDPLTDVGHLRTVVFVMKDGTLHKQPEAAP